MGSSRETREAFGMSVLDMLCCGFGAAALLFVLKNLQTEATREDRMKQATAQTRELQAQIDTVRRVSQELDNVDRIVNTRAKAASDREALKISATVRGLSLEGVKRVIVLLDTSGSMRVYSQREAVDETKWRHAAKWATAINEVKDILYSAPHLEEFAILRLNDQPLTSLHCNGCAIIRDANDVWLKANDESYVRALAALEGEAPNGGSDHRTALRAALDLVEKADDRHPVDAVILVTDGLPNAPFDGLTEGSPRTCDPASRCVSIEKKQALADEVVAEVGQRTRRIVTANENFRLHVIGMKWSDDLWELPAFAIALSAPTNGVVIFL